MQSHHVFSVILSLEHRNYVHLVGQVCRQGSKFTVANVQFATGLGTFAPKKNNLGANLLLQLWSIFKINTFSAPC